MSGKCCGGGSTSQAGQHTEKGLFLLGLHPPMMLCWVVAPFRLLEQHIMTGRPLLMWRLLCCAGPRRTRPHGQSYLPVPLPSLQQVAAEAAAAGKGDRAKLAAVSEAVNCIFSSPAFLLAAMSPAGLAGQPTQQDSCPSALPLPGEAMEVDSGSADTADSGAAAAPAPAGAPPPAAAAAAPASTEQRPATGTARVAGGQASAQPDVGVVTSTYQGLLTLFDAGVVSTLGTACARLLEGE